MLVLEIHVPQVRGTDISGALGKSLILMTPKFLTYILTIEFEIELGP